MQLPETSELFLPILRLLSDQGEYSLQQISNLLADELEINNDKTLDVSQSNTQFYSRVIGAISYLTHAKLIQSPTKGITVISERGNDLLTENPENLSLKSLTQYPEFVTYLQSGMQSGMAEDMLDYAGLSTNGNYDLPLSESTHHTASTNGLNHRQIEQIHSKSTSQQHSMRVSQESFTTTLELFERLKTFSPPHQELQTNSSVTSEENKGLNPALFALLSVMRFFENMFQNVWLYLIPFVLMMIAYAASFFILSDQFVSKGVMFVDTDTLINQVTSLGSDNYSYLSASEQTAEEFTELLNTDSFIRLIIQETPLEAEMSKGDKIVNEVISDVRDAIDVGITGSSNVEVQVTWDDQAVAWKTATATLDSFIDWKINSDKRDSSAAREFLEQLAPQYANERLAAVQTLETYLVQNPEPFRGDRPEIEQLRIEQLRQAVETADVRYQDANDNLEQIRLEEVIAEGQTRQSYKIIDRPNLPVEEEGGVLKKITTGAIFVTLGIVLSLLAAISTTILDRSIRFPIETPSALGFPVLSAVKKNPNTSELAPEQS